MHWRNHSKETEVSVALEELPHPLPLDQQSMSALLSSIDLALALSHNPDHVTLAKNRWATLDRLNTSKAQCSSVILTPDSDQYFIKAAG